MLSTFIFITGYSKTFLLKKNKSKKMEIKTAAWKNDEFVPQKPTKQKQKVPRKKAKCF